ncbi:MAG: hypothetical protein WBC85_11515 [Planktotalea sp.]
MLQWRNALKDAHVQGENHDFGRIPIHLPLEERRCYLYLANLIS